MKIVITCPLCFADIGPLEDLPFPDQTITQNEGAWLDCTECGAPYLLDLQQRELSNEEWKLIQQHQCEVTAESSQ